MGRKIKIILFMFCITIISSMQIALAQTPVPYDTIWADEAKDVTLNPNISSIENHGDKNKYINSRYGYSFYYPSTWSIDKHRDTDFVRLYGSDFRVDIFYDDATLAFSNSNEYINETVKTLSNEVFYQENLTINSLPVSNYDYTRAKINSIENDLNYYSYFFISNNNKVYTVQLKTNNSKFNVLKTQVKNLITSIEFTTANLTDLNKNVDTSKYSPEIKYELEKNTLHIPKNKVAYGTFNGYPSNKIYDMESSLGTHLGSQMLYFDIASNYQSYIEQIINDGRAPVMTFHFDNKEGTTTPSIMRVLNGDYDSYLSSWANGIKNLQAPVFIRIGNEMNADWTDWGSSNIYNDPDLYKIAYRYIVDYFNQVGCSNAYFVWNPTIDSSPLTSLNKESVYYPGDDYVDWIGLTAYNFGDTQWGKFKYFDELYEDMYKSYLRNFPNKPMMIGEFSSTENGGDKAEFIRDVFQKIPTKYPNIKLVIWFSDIDREYDFRINSSKSSEDAFSQAMKDSSVVLYPMMPTVSQSDLILPPKTVTTNNSLWTFTGVALDKRIKSISLNGIKQNFLYSTWRQFDHLFNLNTGDNVIKVQVEYENGSSINLPITVKKNSSFGISTNVGNTIAEAVQENVSNKTITGIVRDSDIKGLKINGNKTDIKWSWRQFDENIALLDGLNSIILEGYSDVDCNNKIIEEKFYLFNNLNNFVDLTSMNNADIKNICSYEEDILGITKSDKVKSIYINGENIELVNGSFSKHITLTGGDNNISLKVIFQDNVDGQKVEYIINKKFVIHTPSFKFSTEASQQTNDIPVLKNSKTEHMLTGLVKNSNVKKLTINGQDVDIKWSWKQFDKGITLHSGINEINMMGYSDYEGNNLLVNEKFYVVQDPELLHISNLTYPTTNVDKLNMVITGMVPDGRVKKVYINGVEQQLKWSWKQFDYAVSLKNGDNKVDFTLEYEEVLDGKVYKYTTTKTYNIHTPVFAFNSNVGNTIQKSVQTDKSSMDFSGMINLDTIKAITVNGQDVAIKDGSFSINVNINKGLNEFEVIGYSDINKQKIISKEYAYVFNTDVLYIKTPTQKSSTSEGYEVTFSGWISSGIKNLKFNEEKHTDFEYEWRQYFHKFILQKGENTIVVTADYEDIHKGIPYSFKIKKEYVVTTAEDLTDIKYSTSVGKTESTVPHVQKYNEVITGLVNNPRIKGIKVNNIPVPIKFSWRQFDAAVELQSGLNNIVVEGFSDENFSNKIFEERVYLYNPLKGISYSKDVGYSKEESVQTSEESIWLSGFINNPKITNIKINNIDIPLESTPYGTKQFGNTIKLDAGLNEILVQGFNSSGEVIFQENIYMTSTIKVLQYTTPVGLDLNNPALVEKAYYWLGGFIKSSKVNKIKVNGLEASISEFSWGRQFGIGTALNEGLNELNIECYDINEQTIFQETLFVNYKK
ncbi:glycoside hydrolase family 26 protein [Haloimpatiens sp. FM7330]|uniref:glycoside hydrolase family 26 protein n=1 Tax=Haloimpatiens sp. FM7330 TaxID=3298610 RepID=UPI00362846AE